MWPGCPMSRQLAARSKARSGSEVTVLAYKDAGHFLFGIKPILLLDPLIRHQTETDRCANRPHHTPALFDEHSSHPVAVLLDLQMAFISPRIVKLPNEIAVGAGAPDQNRYAATLFLLVNHDH